MNVRIEIKSKGNGTVIQVAGELRGRGIVELERLCRETLGPFTLDLSNLRSLEAEGVELIRELAAQGVKMTGVSPYVGLLLKTPNS
jgi:hypothetical protein